MPRRTHAVKEVHTESNGYASVREVECAQGLSEKIKKATKIISSYIVIGPGLISSKVVWLEVELCLTCVVLYKLTFTFDILC